jgi:hypothetical protein
MLFRSLAIASFVATATGQAVAPPGGCLVCGNGNVVMAPDAVFTFPGEPEVPCGTLQEARLGGLIPLDQCAEGELPITEAPAPTDAPVPPPTEAPVPPPSPPSTQAPITQAPIPPTDAPGSCPEVPTTGCSVCGEGLCVGNPDAIFVFPGPPEVLCGDLQEAGLTGGIPLDQCSSLPGLVAVCECGPGATIPPSPAPTIDPTPAPSSTPTIDPTPAPSSTPIIDPTPVPVVEPTMAPVPVTEQPTTGKCCYSKSQSFFLASIFERVIR